jgi:NitT/TauT family transport system substrate-binding protein
MFKKIVLTILGLAISLMGCSSPVSGNDAGTLVHIKVPLGYIPNIQFAPLYVAVEKGYFKDAGIEVEFDYSFETDAVALVGADNLQFAVVSGEQVLLARAQGLPVVYAAAWYQKYPVAVVSKAEQGLKTPADLKGKKIGLPGLFGANYIGLDALLYSAGLTEADVTLDSIGFNQVEALAADQEQAVSVYTVNEPIQLRAQGYDLTEFCVADYVQLASNGILTNEKTIAEKPELVRAFVGAFLNGLQFTIDHPDEAFTLSASHIPNFAELDATVQKQVLATSIEMWQAKQLGYSDPQAWTNMHEVLLKMKLLTKPLDITKTFTNEFIP